MWKLELLGRLLWIGLGRGGRVDPDRGGRALGLWVSAFEAGGVSREGRVPGWGADLDDGFGPSLMEVGRGQEGDPRVAMVVVVPVEAGLAVGAGIFQRPPKRSGKSGRYFRVLNCASLQGLSSLV